MSRPKTPYIIRLFEKFSRGNGCWEWKGPITWNGYGIFVYGQDHVPKGTTAHRAVYQELVGKIPESMQLDHLCKNKLCVNPSHMEVVTARENLMRGETKAAENVSKTHCPKGHEYRLNQSPHYLRVNERRCHVCHAEQEAMRRKEALSLSKI